MTPATTQILTRNNTNPEALQRAAEALKSGATALIPTETVYGLCAHPQSGGAIRKLYELKGRDFNKPFQMLISDITQAGRFAVDIPPGAYRLMQNHWPGPLTIILKAATGGTIGLRVPDHPIALDLIRLSGGALAATSANTSGMTETTDFPSALRLYNNLVDIAIDGGQCSRGSASTVISYASAKPVILRGSPDQRIKLLE